MRIKGLVVGYFTVLAGLFVAAALFCRFMSGRNMLPEGLSLSGGAIGLFTLLYAFFVANCSYMLRHSSRGAPAIWERSVVSAASSPYVITVSW